VTIGGLKDKERKALEEFKSQLKGELREYVTNVFLIFAIHVQAGSRFGFGAVVDLQGI
jgi:hypothetical protein